MPADLTALSSAVTRIRRYSTSVARSLSAIFLGSFLDLGKSRAAPLTARPASSPCPAIPAPATLDPLEVPVTRSLYTADTVAQARSVVLRFDQVVADHGQPEADELRQVAWDILRTDRAARLDALHLPRNAPRDAA